MESNLKAKHINVGEHLYEYHSDFWDRDSKKLCKRLNLRNVSITIRAPDVNCIIVVQFVNIDAKWMRSLQGRGRLLNANRKVNS